MPLSRLVTKLAHIEVVVETFVSQETVVGALLNDLTILEDENFISLLNGGEAVGNDKAGPTFHQSTHGLLYQEFQPGINRGGCFIQNQNLRVSQEGPSNGQKLLLTQGDVAGFLIHFHIVATWQGADKVVNIGCLGCGNDFFK